MVSLRSLFLTSALCGLAALSACNEDTPKAEKIDRLAWSEDGSEIAYVMSRFEESGSNTGPSSTYFAHNYSHQVYLQPADGSPARKIGNEQGLQNLEDFYYFKQAGYFVVSYLYKPLTGPEFKRYYQLTLDGKSYTLNFQSDTQVVPSPNGQTIAIMQHNPQGCQNSGASSASANACQVKVDFVNAGDREPLGIQQKLSFTTKNRVPDMTWTPAGTLVVSNGSEAFALQPATEPQSVSQPGCLSPKTSSGPVNVQGQLAYAEGTSVKSRPEPALPRFGCQG